MGKVSILISAYNEEKNLADCLQSCLAQTYRDIEILVFNDGSTDRTDEVLESFTPHDRISVFHSPFNQGKVYGFNILARHASGAFVHLLGADDVMHPDCISACLEAIAGTDAVYHALRIVDHERRFAIGTLFDARYENRKFDHFFLRLPSIPSGSLFFSRALFDAATPLPEGCPYEDIWFSYIIKKNGFHTRALARELYDYRQSPESSWGGVFNTSFKIRQYRAGRDLRFLEIVAPRHPQLTDEIARKADHLRKIMAAPSPVSLFHSRIPFRDKINLAMKTSPLTAFLLHQFFRLRAKRIDP